VLAALAVVGGIGVVVACGSDPGGSDFGSSSGASGSSGSTGSSSGGFGSSGTASGSSGASGADANPANCNAPIDMFSALGKNAQLVGRYPRGWGFAELCDSFGPRTKRGVIVTFLSVLEMTRLKLIRILQTDDGHISIHPVEDNLRADDVTTSIVDDYDKPPAQETQQ